MRGNRAKRRTTVKKEDQERGSEKRTSITSIPHGILLAPGPIADGMEKIYSYGDFATVDGQDVHTLFSTVIVLEFKEQARRAAPKSTPFSEHTEQQHPHGEPGFLSSQK